MSLFSHECILRRRGDVIDEDQYGRPVYGPPTDTPAPAWWEMTAESEDVAARNQYVSTYTVYLPLSAPIDGWDAVVLDTVVVDGETVAAPGAPEYEAVGRPGQQPGGFVVEGYFRVLVELVTG